MKTRNNTTFVYTVQSTTLKSTGAETIAISSPFAVYDQLTVFQDQLHGDHKSVYPHEFRKLKAQDIVGTVIRDTATETFKQTGKVAGLAVQALPVPSTLRNKAIGDLYEKVRSGEVGSGLDLSIDIAEAHQVRKMLKDSVKVVNFIRRWHPREWANRWLEVQYGWKPLVNSVYGTFDAVMHRRTFGVQVVTGKAFEQSIQFYDENVDSPLTGLKTVVMQRDRLRYKIVAEFKLDNTLQQQLGGYTSLNPVSVAWELMPYSFVVDWFIDVGGYLRNMESALAYGKKGFVRGYSVVGYKSRKDGQLLVYKSRPISGTTVYGEGTGYRQYSYKSRFAEGVYPIPTLPQFKVQLGWQRLLSAASLLSQHVDGYSLWKRRGEQLPDAASRRIWVDPSLRRGLRDLLDDVRLGAPRKYGRFPHG